MIPPVITEGESLESVYQFDYLGCCFTSDGDDEADMRHRMAIAGERSRSLNYLCSDNRLLRSLKLRLYAASVCSTLTNGSEAWMLTPRALATLNGFNSRQLHRIIVSRWGHKALVRPADSCADTEAPLAGPYPAYARRPPSAPCSVGAGPTSGSTVPTGQPADGHTPPPKRTNPASRRPPRMGTRWQIPLLSTGKPLRGETPRIIISDSVPWAQHLKTPPF